MPNNFDIYSEFKTQTLKSDDNLELTENGAVVYGSLGDALVDFNNDIMPMRSAAEEYIAENFAKAYAENPKEAVKCIFQIGDIREGKGERRTFNVCMDYLSKEHPEIMKSLLPLIPEYTRWDYLARQMLSKDKGVAKEATTIVLNQLEQDIEDSKSGKPISLLAKWLPSIQSKDKEERRIAFKIENKLGLDHKAYRKMLSFLRERLNIIEKYMSEHRLEDIDMESLTSHQNLKYRDAFQKWIPEEREAYLKKVLAGEAKMNAGVVYPYEIAHSYMRKFGYEVGAYSADLEALWKMLPDKVNGDNGTIVIRDGSGSMLSPVTGSTSATCLDVATAMSVYFAERQSGAMNNKFITFSSRPEIVDMSHCETLHDKLNLCTKYDDCSNTNIEKTFDLLLNSLKEANAGQDEVPKNILIISDMQFDAATDTRSYWDDEPRRAWDVPLFTQIKEKWNKAGYELPRMVFWQVNARDTQLPMIENDRGLVILSGFSTNNLDMVLNGEFEKEVVNKETGEVEKVTLSPAEQLQKILSKPRYDAVEKAYLEGREKEMQYGARNTHVHGEIDMSKVAETLAGIDEKEAGQRSSLSRE